MYRNLEEHPLIAEVLRNGHVIGTRNSEIAKESELSLWGDLQFVDIDYIFDVEFSQICTRRLLLKQNAGAD